VAVAGTVAVAVQQWPLLLQSPLLFLLQCQEPSLPPLSFDTNRRFSDCAYRRRTFRANGLRASGN
jgi:hypothetical protein